MHIHSSYYLRLEHTESIHILLNEYQAKETCPVQYMCDSIMQNGKKEIKEEKEKTMQYKITIQLVGHCYSIHRFVES